MKLETLAVKAAARPDPSTGGLAPPIHMATTFERDPDGGYPRGFTYGRTGNPNRALLEGRLAALEGAEEALAFASGSAAVLAVLQVLAPGDHVIIPEDVYHGVRVLAGEVMREWRLETSFVDLTVLAKLDAALRPNTRVVWVDSPSNPLLRVTDIRAVAARAHESGALVCVDNTFATPVLQRPLALGADLVVHSTTKYIGGHSDVIGGAVLVGRGGAALAPRLRRLQHAGGAIPSPFDAWLITRGLATLPCRMRAHCANAAAIATALSGHAALAAVIYPGLPSHPDHAVAVRQMEGFGGMISLRLHGGREAAFRALARLKLIARATSLGGVESTIEHRRSIEPAGSPTPDDLVRLSVGLEHPDDLIEDLLQALY
ncbi:MAG: aminotransferase class V-fold PLP-dependent enzyme [Myxococcales bacterium]|nr:aminotransferase class V-fold PLP-dependent enzyme [Myxococcales bacterium]